MATNENCTSNPSNNTPNAFTPEFLKKLFDREDAPLAALEAEMRGPWKVVDLPIEGKVSYSFDTERWGVMRAWEDPEVDRPAGTFRFREVALIYAAALAVASRGASLTIDPDPEPDPDPEDDDGGGGDGGGSASGEGRLPVVQWTYEGRVQVVGHVPLWDDDVNAALRYVEALLHCNEALAQLLEAGCGPIAELLGRRLMALE